MLITIIVVAGWLVVALNYLVDGVRIQERIAATIGAPPPERIPIAEWATMPLFLFLGGLLWLTPAGRALLIDGYFADARRSPTGRERRRELLELEREILSGHCGPCPATGKSGDSADASCRSRGERMNSSSRSQAGRP